MHTINFNQHLEKSDEAIFIEFMNQQTEGSRLFIKNKTYSYIDATGLKHDIQFNHDIVKRPSEKKKHPKNPWRYDVIGTCIGGTIGGATMTRFDKQHIRLAMVLAFSLIIVLLLLNQFHLLPVEGDIAELRGKKLIIGFFGMMLCGALTAAGIGLFVMVQAVLFLLQVSPLVAFPVMTISGAMQQPLTAMMFLKQKNLPLNRILMISLAGCAGVLMGIVLFKHLTTTWLHSLLLGILLYNLIAVGRSWLRHHRGNKDREGVYEQDIAVAGSAVKP